MTTEEIPNNCGTNCSGKCIIVEREEFVKTYECIANSTYYFCKDSMKTFWIVLSCFVGLNVIAFIGTIIRGGHRTDMCTFIVSILQNIALISTIMGFTCLQVIGNGPQYMLPFLLGLFGGIGMNAVTFCVLKSGRSRNVMFKNNGEPDDMDTANEYSSKAHNNPPLIKIRGVLSYRTYGRKGKKRSEYVKFFDYIPYRSWRADSSPEHIELKGHSVIKVINDFTFSESLQKDIDDRKKVVSQMIERSGSHVTRIVIRNKVYCVSKARAFGPNCFLDFYNSCLGFTVYRQTNPVNPIESPSSPTDYTDDDDDEEEEDYGDYSIQNQTFPANQNQIQTEQKPIQDPYIEENPDPYIAEV